MKTDQMDYREPRLLTKWPSHLILWRQTRTDYREPRLLTKRPSHLVFREQFVALCRRVNVDGFVGGGGEHSLVGAEAEPAPVRDPLRHRGCVAEEPAASDVCGENAGPWADRERAMSGPWAGRERAVSGPWAGRERAVSGPSAGRQRAMRGPSAGTREGCVTDVVYEEVTRTKHRVRTQIMEYKAAISRKNPRLFYR